MRNMLKDAVILLVITLIAGLALGIVYDVTKEPIAEQQLKAKNEAFAEVFADADNFITVEDISIEKADMMIEEAGYAETSIEEVAEAFDESGNTLGYVLTVTSHEGYNGDITFTMGIRLDNTLNGISLLSISETPGLGDKAEDVLKPQFTDKQVDQFTYTKSGAMADNQIDAISGATITTNALTNGINAGLYYFQSFLVGGGSQGE